MLFSSNNWEWDEIGQLKSYRSEAYNHIKALPETLFFGFHRKMILFKDNKASNQTLPTFYHNTVFFFKLNVNRFSQLHRWTS